jgi:titin
VLNTTNVVLASATTTVTTPAIPLAPSAVTSIATSTQITVNWTDNSNNEDGFVLERSDNGGTYRQIPGVGAFLPPNATSYVDKMVGGTLLPNVVYQYRVKAINLVTGSSGYAMGTPVSLLSAPLAPSNFTAMLGGLPGNLPRVLLAWTDNSTNETGFNVQRHTGTNQCNATAGWTNLNQPANATAALNTGVSAGSGYCYRIQSTNTSGQSAWVTVTVTVPQSPSNQNDPAVGLTVGSATVSSLQVSFAVPQPAIGYQLRYGTGNKGNWTTLTQTAATGNITVTLGSLQSGTAYQVQVSEATTGGWSSWSNSRTGTTLTPPSAPSSPNVSNPGNCTSSNSGACTQTVTFSIVNANPSINGWVLQRCQGNTTNSNNALTGNGQNCAANGAGWANLTTGAGAGNQSVSSTGLQDNTFYSYRVNRSNAIGTSSWSNVASSKRQ